MGRHNSKLRDRDAGGGGGGRGRGDYGGDHGLCKDHARVHVSHVRVFMTASREVIR